MIRWMWRGFLRMLGLLKGPGKGNSAVHRLFHEDKVGWVKDVTGVVVWIKPVDEAEKKERRRRFWRHVWRSLKELFGAKAVTFKRSSACFHHLLMFDSIKQ